VRLSLREAMRIQPSRVLLARSCWLLLARQDFSVPGSASVQRIAHLSSQMQGARNTSSFKPRADKADNDVYLPIDPAHQNHLSPLCRRDVWHARSDNALLWRYQAISAQRSGVEADGLPRHQGTG